jgi:hypothetical protein
MMKKLFTTVSCIIPLLFVTGCATLTPTQLARTQAILNATVPIAVEYAVIKETRTIPYFRAAADAIDLAASTGNIDPTKLVASLQALGVKELKTPEAELAIMAGVGIYQVFFAETVSGDVNAVAILHTLAMDIRQGLPPVTTTKGHKSQVKRR